MKKILITGAAGYIGSVLVRQLLSKNYSVRGADLLLFGGESLLDIYSHPNFEFLKFDLRDFEKYDQLLKDVTDVIHLAAIVGDPACAQQPELAKQVNWECSRALFDKCNTSGIKKFIFASTCSNYGKMEGNSYVDESSELKPVSLYAELKVRFEQYLLETQIREDFSPTALRFSTVYGLSPRMRFDLTVNEFIREVACDRELEIFGEQFWRPYCHVSDLARACVMVLESDTDKVRKNVFNVGDTSENYQKKMIAEEIIKIKPDAKVTYVERKEDPRDYKVNFDKISKTLGYRISKKVPDGLKEIYNAIGTGIISDPYSSSYKNV